MLKPAGTYEAVYEALQQVQQSSGYRGNVFYKGDMVWVEEEMDTAVSDELAPIPDSVENGMGGDSDGELSFSETNVQVDGIDEADIIKTDGQYFYVFDMNRNAIYIVSAKG
ncbi:MAG: beta-propeller domain-containing protein, partial [Lachnospiraceae bacterium]|nr:beta-propeller domain-containing protein [Lachnospiraceae bacterium]